MPSAICPYCNSLTGVSKRAFNCQSCGSIVEIRAGRLMTSDAAEAFDLGAQGGRGSAQKPTTVVVKPQKKSSCLGCFVVLLFSFGCMMVISMLVAQKGGPGQPLPSAPAADSKPNQPPATVAPSAVSTKVGDRIALGYKGGGGTYVWLARTDNDWDAMLDAENATNKDLLAMLIAKDRVLMVKTGSQAVIEKRAFASAFVNIMTGEHAGQSGWIQFEMLRPLSEYP